MEKQSTFTVAVCTLTTYIVVILPDTIQTISCEGMGAFRCSQSLLMTGYPQLDTNLKNFCYFTIGPDCFARRPLLAVWGRSGHLPNQHGWFQEGPIWLFFSKRVGLKVVSCCCTVASVLSLSAEQSNLWKEQIFFINIGTQNKTICLSYNMQNFPTAYFSSSKCDLHRLNFRICLQDSWEKTGSLILKNPLPKGSKF